MPMGDELKCAFILLLRCFLLNSMYCGINGWAYFREKSILCNNFIIKGGLGVFLRVGLFSGDYGRNGFLALYFPCKILLVHFILLPVTVLEYGTH